MPDGGLITIAAREEPNDGGLPTRGYVALSVSDTGCGMDDETLKHAQEPFFTTKGVGKGTGLGLSMVHGLAEQSGGRLVLRSRPGGGTTADIWLPIAEETAVPDLRAEAPAPVPRASRQLSVLVVDDDLLVLENTAVMLEDLGHAVVEARSGEEALALLRRTRTVDLIVTDYAMPGMTGLQLASAVAAERAGTVILLSTGYAEIPSDARSSLPRLSKPLRATADEDGHYSFAVPSSSFRSIPKAPSNADRPPEPSSLAPARAGCGPGSKRSVVARTSVAASSP